MAAREEGRAGVALLIGIGDYLQADRVGSLRFATHDARALAEVLVEPDVCGFPPDRVLLLTGAEAGRDELVRRLSKWLPETARGAEIVFLSFAGHGAVQRVGRRDEGFLLPYDADPEDLVTRGIAMSDLGRWIEGIEAETVVVCLDCCHAARVLTRQGQARGTAAAVEVRDMTIRPELLRGLSGKGRHLFASCDEGQVSVEVEPLAHGLFTYHLLKGLRGEADRDGDGRVGVAELFEFVAEAVERDARQLGYVQKPWNHSIGPGGVYLSRPGERRGRPDVLTTIGPSAGPSEAGRAPDGVDIGRIDAALDGFRRTPCPEAVPGVFKALAHASPAVRERAKQALQAIGWKRTVALIEDLARAPEPGSFGAILDGLAAFEAHRDVVALLDRLVSLLRGDPRNRAILLLERKRLALGLEDVAEVFRELRSPYRLRKVLGQGLFTAAYLARDEETDLEVTVRVLRPEYAGIPQLRALFLDLGRKAVRLVHQNLVLTREVRAVPDRQIYYAVRDYVDGVTLQRLLESGRTFTPAQILTILRQVLQALTPLHANGWPHGGIKPSNVFLCGDDRVILGDPALPAREIGLASRRLSYDYRYAAPELFRDDGVLGTTSDFYSLGCLAHELACGAPPFVSDNPHVLAASHDHKPVLAPSRRGSRLEWAGDPFLLRLLAKSALERFSCIEDALGAIAALADPPKRQPSAYGAGAPLVHRFVEDPEGSAPLVGEESLVRYDRDQSIVSFDPESTGGATLAPKRRAAAHPDERAIERIGPYVTQRQLGQGGMGVVYLARDERLDRLVAIKVLPRQIGQGSEARARFFREARAVAGLSHPNIVSIYDVGEQDGTLYTVLEFVGGGDLREMISRGPISPESAAALLLQLARAMESAHRQGILHRDLKPSNVMLTAEGVPKISDFGLAKLLHEHHSEDVQMTHSGQVIGTPAYMSPEQALGEIDRIGPATDIFSLGSIFYELLTSRRPFAGGSVMDMLYQVLHKDPLPPSSQRADLPPDLDLICLRCLKKLPEERYASAAALAEDLQRFLAGDSFPHPPILEPVPPSPRRVRFWRRLFPG